ncbi:MAG: hypothetical protein AB8E15_05905 [Bdellovibrionales bacterium]
MTIRELAPLYDPNILSHENKTYIERVAELRKETEALAQGTESLFKIPKDRSWTPPKLEDLEDLDSQT